MNLKDKKEKKHAKTKNGVKGERRETFQAERTASAKVLR